MKTVFLTIPNYIFSSDLLRSRYIHELSGRFKVIVLIQPWMMTGGAPYPRINNVEYVEWSLERPRFWNFFGKLLRYSLIRKFDFESVVARNKETGLKDKRRALLALFSHLLPKSWITPELFTFLETTFLSESDKWRKLIKKHRPALILTPTAGFNPFDAEAIIRAKRAGIPTVAVNFNWDNLYNGGIHFRSPDYLFVLNHQLKHTAVHEYGYLADRVFVPGPLRFDNHIAPLGSQLSREQFLKNKNLDPKEKTILLATVTNGNYQNEYKIAEQLIEARERGVFEGYPNIIVRMHPKEDESKYQHFWDHPPRNFALERAGKRRPGESGTEVEMDEVDIDNLRETIRHSDVVVSYRSTMSLEVLLFDKPVVNICFPAQYERGYADRYYVDFLATGAARLACSFDELNQWINRFFVNPELDAERRIEARAKLLERADGLAYKRNVDYIEICSIISKSL